MNRILVFAIMYCMLGATTAFAQDRSHLSVPYRFRLPFLAQGEYVISAFGGNIWQEFNTQFFDSPAASTSDNSNSWFDVNGVIALSDQFLIGAEFTVYPGRTTRKFDVSPGRTSIGMFRYEDEVDTHVAREFVVVYRPVESFEVFAFYFQDTPQWTRTNSIDDPFNAIGFDNDIKDFRAGVTYFGKF